nr:hypothetical protein Q903MT_gene5956 [Picea sitchensis]
MLGEMVVGKPCNEGQSGYFLYTDDASLAACFGTGYLFLYLLGQKVSSACIITYIKCSCNLCL